MTDRPSPVTPAPDDPLAALAAQYPKWAIGPAAFGFAAEHRSASGHTIRYISAHTIKELAEKLSVAELVEP
jgi:hypothetical protein